MKKILFVAMGFLLAICSWAHALDGKPLASDMKSSLLSAFMSQADSHIVSVAGSLDILAQSDQVRSGDWDLMEPLLAVYQDAQPHLALFFIRPDGSYFRAKAGLTGKNIKGREYFPGLMNGNNIFCHLVTSKSTGKKVAFIASPVRKDGRVIGAVGASVYLADLSLKLTKTLNFPDNMFFYALAKDGTTTLHSWGKHLFLDPRKQKNPSMAAAMEKLLKSDKGEVSYKFKDIPRRVIFQKSPVTGWKYAVGTVKP